MMDPQKRRKQYFSNSGNFSKKRRQFSLDAGMTGFLCTCNFQEKDCIRDAYKVLTEFAEELYGEEFKKVQKGEERGNVEGKDDTNNSQKEDEEKDDEDISTALSKEINELKSDSAKPAEFRTFQAVDTGVKNVIFIRTTLENPLELVTKIVTTLDETKKQRTRFLLRLLPIELVCKAYLDDIKAKASVLFEKYFTQEPKTFCIVFNRHSNNKIQRKEVIEDLAAMIHEKNPGNKANLTEPEIAVVVEIIRGFCLISIAPNYFKLKKYNLVEICSAKEAKEQPKDTSETDKVETEKESVEDTSPEKEKTEDA